MAMRNASTGQFSVRALFLAAGLMAAVPVIASAQGGPVPDSHTVRKGDTLWDLAKTYFGDPLVWPQIYKLNTAVVEDPHWIYPGEVLQLTGTGGGVIPSQPAAEPTPPVAVAPEVAPAAEGPPPAAEGPPAQVEPEVYAEVPVQPSGGRARGAGPIPGDPVALFGVVGATSAEQMLEAHAQRPYRALRPGEFYSAGFLTENQKLPFGQVMGDVTPLQVANLEPPSTASQFSKIGIIPPKGAAYQVGDSLLLAQVLTSYAGFGDIVWPTGIARVVEVGPKQTTAIVLNQFERIRIGQVALPLERFVPGGAGQAVPVSDGIEAWVVEARSDNILTEQQSILFLDKGRADGVAPGDVFELWRTPEERYDVAATIAEPMARVQIVRVGEHTSSALVVRIIDSNLKPGLRAVQVAKLPN